MVDFNHALQMAPRLTDAYVWRGKAYIFKFNKYDQAIADFSKALEIDPLSGEAYLGRAQAYYFKKDLTRSLEDQKKARALGYKTKIEKEIEKAEED
jgi:tetratricopeptide (TPR) repeat protein